MNLNKLILTSLCAIITATAAYATGENIVASKKYTDDTFQTKIPAEVSTLSDMTGDAGALIGATDANGVVMQRLIIPGYKRASGNGELGTTMYQQTENGTIPYGYLGNITDEFTAMLEDMYNVFNDGNYIGYDPRYSVPSMELALDWVNDIWNKSQRTITGHAANAVDSVLTDSTTDGNVQKRAIYDGSATYAAGTHASQIPTMGAVMSALANGTEKMTWSATQTAAVNNYSTTFDGTANNWVATDSGKLVDGSALANAVALKQNKKVCAGWPDSVAVADRSDANCWLWELP